MPPAISKRRAELLEKGEMRLRIRSTQFLRMENVNSLFSTLQNILQRGVNIPMEQ